MIFQLELESLVLDVELINKKSIKHCYLRVLSPKNLQIKANKYFKKEDALVLIENKKSWIEKQILRLEKNSLNNNEFLFLGERREFSGKFDVDKFYKEQIKIYLPPILDEYSKLMNLSYSSLKFRKNKSTWGSCSFKNDLSFNILLMKFPKEVIEYVIVHELAHIKHKNHSKNFWSLVEEYYPTYKKAEKLLKSFL